MALFSLIMQRRCASGHDLCTRSHTQQNLLNPGHTTPRQRTRTHAHMHTQQKRTLLTSALCRSFQLHRSCVSNERRLHRSCDVQRATARGKLSAARPTARQQTAPSLGCDGVRVVAKVGPHPLLRLLDRLALALRILHDLVLAHLADLEVGRALVGEAERRDRRGRQHGERVGQLNADLLVRLDQFPHERLLGVVGLRRVAGRRADALILGLEHVVVRQLLVGRVAPELLAHLVVQELGKGLGEAVGDGLHHDALVVVVLAAQLGADVLAAEAGRDGERANVVRLARVLGRHEVRERVADGVLALLLLAKRVEGAELRARPVGVVHLDVVADRVRRPDADHAVGLEHLLLDDLFDELHRVCVQLLGLLADRLVVEELRVSAVGVLAAQLPYLEEGVPVDVRQQLLEVVVDVLLEAEEVGRRDRDRLPVDDKLLRARLLEREELARRERRVVVLAQLLILLAHVLHELGALLLVQQRLAHRDRARGVEHVHRKARRVVGRDLDGGVHLGGGGTADEQRDRHAGALHLLGDRDHLVERRRDEARAAEDVGLVVDARREDVARIAHDARVDDRVVVAAKHDADDVLADVVHVALDGRHDDDALALLHERSQPLRLTLRGDPEFLLLHERQQVRDGLLHHARRLDHLRQEHLARAEEVANDVHARHQRPLDHLQVGLVQVARLLRVLLDKLGEALDESVRQPLGDRSLPPRQLVDDLGGAAELARILALLLLFGELEQPLHVLAVRRVVEDHLLNVVAHRLRDVVEDGHTAGVDDTHRHALLDRMVEEDRVDRLAQRSQAAETKREVRNATRDFGARQVGVRGVLAAGNPVARFDEVLAVVVVLDEASGDREHVRVENDVPRREVDLGADHDVVRALAHVDLVLVAGGLALLVEGHDDNGGAKALDNLGLADKLGLALLERDGVDDALALAALKAGLDDVEFGRVDHERQLRDVGLGDEHVEELLHRVLAVEQALVHVDVDHLRARLGLVARDLERLVVLAVEDELLVLHRARNVAPLADVHEAEVLVDGQWLEARDAHLRKRWRALTRLEGGAVGDGLRDHLVDSLDVLGRRAAAAAERVDQAVVEEELDRGGEGLWRLVVAAHRVREAGVRVRVHKALGHVGERLHERQHLVGSECAVEADADRLRMRHRDVKRFGRLPRERAATHVHNRSGDHDGQARAARLLVILVDGVEGGLGVERVEDGLDEDDVRAAVNQPGDLLLVGRDDLVPSAVAIARVLDRRRDRERAVGRPNRASDEARAVRLLLSDLLGGVDRELARNLVHLVHDVLHRVVSLRDRRAGKGVGLADVSAALEVAPVDLADRVGLRENKKIVVALKLLGLGVVLEHLHAEVLLGKLVLLDGRAHRAIDNHDALLHRLGDVVGDRLGVLLARHPPGKLREGALDLLGDHLGSVLLRSTISTGVSRTVRSRSLCRGQMLFQLVDHLFQLGLGHVIIIHIVLLANDLRFDGLGDSD
mmetsp:Transcript_55188/g.146427  ORF Transcript_55188/g.146427 Transcript_55188/m.146427 type:complete len:1471 (+) Transcript_55188:155-4567(+)